MPAFVMVHAGNTPVSFSVAKPEYGLFANTFVADELDVAIVGKFFVAHTGHDFCCDNVSNFS